MIYSNVDDLRRAAQRRLPRMFFDYLDGGAFSEHTMARNTRDFDRWWLEQRVLRDVTSRDLGCSFLGQRHALPIMLAPVGFAGMFWPNGEVEAARAARAAGIPMCLSTFSINSVEEVGAALPESLAFQLYVFRDRKLAEALMARASAVGVKSLFLTADTNVSSIRERDTRNGFRTADSMSLSSMLDIASRPGWCLRMARAGWPQLGNARGQGMPRNLMSQATMLSANVDPSISWKDLAWLRERWPGKLVIKGILSPADAQDALSAGADAIVVSNHGGRQLDGARSSISVLPGIADQVAGRAEILFDSGVRRGSQIIKALALGADGVLIGKAFGYGLAAGGQAGVARAIELLGEEANLTLGLMGLASIEELKRRRSDVVGCYDALVGELDAARSAAVAPRALANGTTHLP